MGADHHGADHDNREALTEAALARWGETGTEEIIAALESEPAPERRLRRLLATVDAAMDALVRRAQDLASGSHRGGSGSGVAALGG